VIRHCDDHEQDFDFTLDELNALHQAISALLKLILAEESNDSYAATAMCFRYVKGQIKAFWLLILPALS
jgi:hypothetical protein